MPSHLSRNVNGDQPAGAVHVFRSADGIEWLADPGFAESLIRRVRQQCGAHDWSESAIEASQQAFLVLIVMGAVERSIIPGDVVVHCAITGLLGLYV